MTRILLLALLAAAPALAQTHAAARARLDAEFARTDTNRDGRISRAELARRLAGMHGAGPHARAAADRLFVLADANHDGGVDRAEARALFDRMFMQADRDGDGRLDAGERAQARAALR